MTDPTAEGVAEREALIRQLAEQLKQHGISPGELALAELAPPDPAQVSTSWWRLAASVACLLMFSGFLGAFWPAMSQGLRLFCTLGIGLLVHLSVIVTLRKKHVAWLGQALLLSGTMLEFVGLFVLTSAIEPAWATAPQGTIIPLAGMAVQESLIYRGYRQAAWLLYALFFAYTAAMTTLHALGVHPVANLMACGLSLMAVSELIASQRSAASLVAALGLGMAYFALFKLVAGTSAEIAYALLLISAVWMGVRWRRHVLHGVSSACTLLYGIYALSGVLLQTAVWPFALMLIASAAAGWVWMSWRWWRLSGGAV